MFSKLLKRTNAPFYGPFISGRCLIIDKSSLRLRKLKNTDLSLYTRGYIITACLLEKGSKYNDEI